LLAFFCVGILSFIFLDGETFGQIYSVLMLKKVEYFVGLE